MVSENCTPNGAKGEAPSKGTAEKTKAANGSTKPTQQGKTPSRRRRIVFPKNTEGPRRVSAGKVNLNTLLFYFIGGIAALLWVTSKSSSMFAPGAEKEFKRITKAPPFRQEERKQMWRKFIFDPLLDTLLKYHPEIFEGNLDQSDPCGLYLTQSSIPETGWGWFAGKNYDSGEAIRIETLTTGGIPSGSLLLKPHSVLSNVKWEAAPQAPSEEDWSASVLVATREIQEGEEFFLSWEDHLYSSVSDGPFDYVFADVLPLPEHFSKANEYIQEAHTQYFGAINYAKPEVDENQPKKPRYKTSNARWNRAYGKRERRIHAAKHGNLFKPESAVDINKGLTLWKRTLEKFDPLVAKLLPTKAETLAQYHRKARKDESLFSSSSLFGSLQNQTINSLSKSAICVSSFEWQLTQPPAAIVEDGTPQTCGSDESCASDATYRQIVTRKNGFSKGEIVGVIPLLVMPQSHPIESSAACLVPVSKDKVLCPLGGIQERTSDASLANVVYKYSDSRTEEKYPLSMTLDIVALRDLQQNETVRPVY
jgi:hypothetical protein